MSLGALYKDSGERGLFRGRPGRLFAGEDCSDRTCLLDPLDDGGLTKVGLVGIRLDPFGGRPGRRLTTGIPEPGCSAIDAGADFRRCEAQSLSFVDLIAADFFADSVIAAGGGFGLFFEPFGRPRFLRGLSSAS